MVGGTTAGYCDTGNTTMAMMPRKTSNKAMTLASTGRSIKNLEIMCWPPFAVLA